MISFDNISGLSELVNVCLWFLLLYTNGPPNQNKQVVFLRNVNTLTRYLISIFRFRNLNVVNVFQVKEDTLKQLKKLQAQLKDAIRDAEEARQGREEQAQAAKDAERKAKTLEAEGLQLVEDLASSERARRAAETERDELTEEMMNSSSKVPALLYNTTLYIGIAHYSAWVMSIIIIITSILGTQNCGPSNWRVTYSIGFG